MERLGIEKFIVVCTLMLLSPVEAFGQQHIRVGPNVHVSKKRADRSHYETLLAADPNNPKRLLGGSIIATERGQHKTIVYASLDAGKSWEPTLELDEALTLRDPACAYGPDGTAYFLSFGFDSDFKFDLFLYRSNDGGKTWLPPTVLPSVDRPYVTVDATGGKYHGRVYIHGVSGVKTFDREGSISGVTILRSVDGGASFEPPVKLVSLEDHYVLGIGNGVVLSDGTLAIIFPELRHYQRGSGVPEAEPSKPNAWLKVITSEDGGESFSKAGIIDDFYLQWAPKSTSNIPYIAVDRSAGPFRDRLYAVWPDVRSGRSEVLLAYSSDKGKTWSKPVVVNDDEPRPAPDQGPDNFMPVVAVNGAGVVGVMWYDRRDNPDNLGWWVRFAASLDGGETFLPSVKVSEAPFAQDRDEPFLLDTIPRVWWGYPRSFPPGDTLRAELFLTYFFFSGGDTAGMAADADGIFHPFWIDNRTGVPQVWTANVTVQGQAIRNGSPGLENLEDISDKVTLDFSAARYDHLMKTISVEACLRNTSEETLVGPIKVRVLSLKSKVGRPEIMNADNQESGSRAVMDFSGVLKDNKLTPGEKLNAKCIELRLYDVPSLRPGRPTDNIFPSLVNIEARVFGKAQVPSSQ
jgi:hypothetical protein